MIDWNDEKLLAVEYVSEAGNHLYAWDHLYRMMGYELIKLLRAPAETSFVVTLHAMDDVDRRIPGRNVRRLQLKCSIKAVQYRHVVMEILDSPVTYQASFKQDIQRLTDKWRRRAAAALQRSVRRIKRR